MRRDNVTHIHPSWLPPASLDGDDAFRLAWDRTPPTCRAVLADRARGKSTAQIAAERGIATRTVGSHLFEAIGRLPGLADFDKHGRLTRACYMIGKLGLEG